MERSISLNSATRRFAAEHAADDVRLLALQGCKDPQVDMALALQQIQGRQTARRKLPSWAALDDIVYPPHLNMEQCSSEATARYKARLASLLADRRRLTDLTGGFGVDFAWMSRHFAEAVYVEQNAALHDTAKANFATLGLSHVSTVCADATDFLRHSGGHASFVFIDPARRDSHGQRTFGIGDCTPDVLPLMDELLAKAGHVLLKLSPMLDWRKAVSDVGASRVEQVHIVSVGNECKELLLLLSAGGSAAPQLVCADLASTPGSQWAAGPSSAASPSPTIVAFPIGFTAPVADIPSPLPWTADGSALTGCFLHEPNASLMKAGLFAALAARYGVSPLAPNSHLFASREPVAAFPGRTFRVEAASSMNKKELRERIFPLGQANISVRNFPMSAEQLRRKLKLGEGGGNYLFATTLASGERVLLLCRKPGQCQ